MKWRHAQQRAKTQSEGTDTEHGQGTETDHGQGTETEHAEKSPEDRESSPAKKEDEQFDVSGGRRDFEKSDVIPREAVQSNAVSDGRATSPLYVTDTQAVGDATAVDLTTDRPPDDAEVMHFDLPDSASDLCDSENESIDV